jgi:hypothetical protein
MQFSEPGAEMMIHNEKYRYGAETIQKWNLTGRRV